MKSVRIRNIFPHLDWIWRDTHAVLVFTRVNDLALYMAELFMASKHFEGKQFSKNCCSLVIYECLKDAVV